MTSLAELTRRHSPSIRSKIFAVLTNEQTTRFSQLEWQEFVSLNALKAFEQDSLDKALRFSVEQKRQLRKMLTDFENEPSRSVATKANLEGYKTIYESFSQEQKATWREMLGAPTNLSNLKWLEEFMRQDLASPKVKKEKK